MKQANIEIATISSHPRYTIMPGEFLVLGRSSGADIQLSGDTAISRLHCKIFYDSQEYWIEDLGSRNHTYVNKAKVSRQVLQNGDRIQIGRHIVNFTLSNALALSMPLEQENLLKREDKLMGKIAVKLGIITRETLRHCVKKQEEMDSYCPMEELLLKQRIISDDQLQQILNFKNDIPFQIPHYEMCELIAMGGMGRIYRARSLESDQWVAIKVFCEAPEGLQDQLKEQFRKEAMTILKLCHPNIVAGIEFGETNCIYLVMEYISGPTLQQYVKDKGERLLPDEACDIVIQITRALKYAHQHGVVHRDIKPENILLTNDRVVKLCDFGLVKNIGQTEEEKEEKIFGTVAYMSPEQIRGSSDIDIRSDIYSLGAVFYRLVFGRIPFMGDSQKIRMQHLSQPLVFPNEGKNLRKMEIARVIRKTMEKEAKARYQSPQEMLRDLEAVRMRFEEDIAGTTEDIAGTAEIIKIQRDPSKTGAFPLRSIFTLRTMWSLRFFVEVLLVFVVLPLLAVLSLFSWRYYEQWKAYEVIVESMENSQYDRVEEKAEDFLATYPDSHFDFKVRTIFQKSLYERAVSAYKDQNMVLASNLCTYMFRVGEDSETEQKGYLLMEAIRQEEERRQNERQAFLECLQKIEGRLKDDDLATAEAELLQVRQLYALEPRFSDLYGRYEEERKFQQNLTAVDLYLDRGDLKNAGELLEHLRSSLKEESREKKWHSRHQRLADLEETEMLAPYHYYPASGFPEFLTEPARETPVAVTVTKTMPGVAVQPGEWRGVFFMPVAGYLHCLDAYTGKVLWSSYIENEAIDWLLFKEWEEVTDSSKANQVLLSPKGGNTLKMVAIMSGDIIWKRSLPAKMSSRPLSYQKDIFVSCEDSYCYRISVARGEILGGFLLPGPGYMGAVDLDSQILYIGSSDKFVYGFELKTGRLTTRFPYQGELLASPVILPPSLILVLRKGQAIVVRYCGLASPRDFKDFDISEGSAEIEMHPDGMLITGEKGSHILLWNGQSNVGVDSFSLPGNPRYAYFLEKGEVLLAGDDVEIHSRMGRTWQYRSKSAKDSLFGRPYLKWQRAGSLYFIAMRDKRGHWGNAFDLGNPTILKWQTRLAVRITSALVTAQGIWVATGDGAVYKIDIARPNSPWQLLLPAREEDTTLCLLDLPKWEKIMAIREAGKSFLLDYGGNASPWQRQEESPLTGLVGAAHRLEKMVFIVQGTSLKAFSIQDGRQHALFPRSSENAFTTAPTYHEKSLYVGNRDGSCYRLELRKVDDKWVLLKKWNYATGAPIFAAPLVHDKNVYFGSDNGCLYCLTLEGKHRWEYQSDASIRCSPLIAEKILYFGNEAGTLCALKSNSGQLLWEQKLSGAIRATPIYMNGNIYVATARGQSAAFNAQNGARAWSLQLEGNVEKILLNWNGRLYAAADNGFLYIVSEK